MNWWACVLLFFACYVFAGIFNWIDQTSEHSRDVIGLIYDIFLHILAIGLSHNNLRQQYFRNEWKEVFAIFTVLCLGLYISPAISNISLKEMLNKEQWPAVCETLAAKNGYDSDVWIDVNVFGENYWNSKRSHHGGLFYYYVIFFFLVRVEWIIFCIIQLAMLVKLKYLKYYFIKFHKTST